MASTTYSQTIDSGLKETKKKNHRKFIECGIWFANNLLTLLWFQFHETQDANYLHIEFNFMFIFCLFAETQKTSENV